MNTLVTGGSGLVGSAVIAELLEKNRPVRALARSEKAEQFLSSTGVQPVRGDILDQDSLLAAMRGCEVVYHVAGRVEFCPRHPKLLYETNVEGTRNVMRAARQAGVRRVLYTSSVVSLGEKPGSVGNEQSEHRGWFISHYERSKFQGEEAAFSEGGDIEVVVVNPASVQGEGRTRGSGQLLLALINQRYPILVDAPVSIVDVLDCARGHVLAEERGLPGERYVLSGSICTVREMQGIVDHLLGRTSKGRYLPRWTLRPLAPVAGWLGRFIRSAPVCGETLRLAHAGARYDGSRATRELGLEYRTLAQTLAQTLDWFRAEGLVRI